MSAKNKRKRSENRESQGETPSPVSLASPPAFNPKFSALVAALCFVICAVLLFARLGHYSLWDDETMVALVAKGVLRTGDTSAVVDHNLVAFHNGVLLHNLHDRSTPPLATYLTAVSIGLLGENAFAARLPFALIGLATVGLILWWLWQDRAPPLLQLFVMLGCIGNVSLLLFLRQCRYYAPAVFFSVAVVYLYLHWHGNKRRLWLLSACSILLFAANYLNHIALYVCLAVDYFLWRRKEQPLRGADWAILLLPQVVLCGALACVWNPLRTAFGGFVARNDFADRLKLFAWNWRDLNDAEFFVGALILAAPVIGFLLRTGSGPRPAATDSRLLWRGSLALLVYVTFVTIVSPQVVKETSAADVRYLVPVIPLCIGIEALVLGVIARRQRWLAVALAVVAFGTNLLNGGPLTYIKQVRSTFAAYVGELIRPPDDPYAAAARWINDNVGDRETVSVVPDYMIYPLMFHAPKAVYVWQLQPPATAQFEQLDKIHFVGLVPPDYIVGFGPAVQDVTRLIASGRLPDFRYERVAVLNVYWRCLYRPEVFWHHFKPVTRFKPDTEAIYIFRHVPAAAGPTPPAASPAP